MIERLKKKFSKGRRTHKDQMDHMLSLWEIRPEEDEETQDVIEPVDTDIYARPVLQSLQIPRRSRRSRRAR